jgi:3-phenylpropionate/cinnamic acid dioxygenase small subunit
MTTVNTATKTVTQTGTLMPSLDAAPKAGTQATTGTQGNTDGARLKASDPIYGDILDFLIDEAALLDDDRHVEWLDCLTDDIIYQMPVRKTVYRRNGDGFDGRNSHWDDNRQSLGLRVKRSVDLPSAFDRDPAPHIRRMVTNLVVRKTDTPGEYAATTYMLLLRNRFDAPTYDILSAKRKDLIRRGGDGTCKLASRLILVDQTALGAVFINVFM